MRGFRPRRRHVLLTGVFVVADVTRGLCGRTPVQRIGELGVRGELVCSIQRVMMPVTGAESWTVLGNDGVGGGSGRAVPGLLERVGALAEHGAGVCAEFAAVV